MAVLVKSEPKLSHTLLASYEMRDSDFAVSFKNAFQPVNFVNGSPGQVLC